MRVLCGADIVEIGRMERVMTASARFAEKVFTRVEIGYCESKKSRKYESYAARFAAKEAVLKALGTGMSAGVAFTEIEVENDARTGTPAINLSGKAAGIFSEMGCTSLSVSLSHTSANALATVVLLCE